MTEPLAQADLTRLAKMLRLLGSASVGERAAAALKVHEFVEARGLDWETLLAPPEAPPAVVSVSVGGSREAEASYGSWAAQSARMHAVAAQMANAQAAAAQAQQYAWQQQQNAAMAQGLGASPYDYQPAKPSRTWRHAAGECLGQAAKMRGTKETDFVQGLLVKGWRQLTDKQETWLRDICARCGVEAW